MLSWITGKYKIIFDYIYVPCEDILFEGTVNFKLF